MGARSTSTRECPDCQRAMESVTVTAGGNTPKVKTDERRDDFLGRLGMNERHDVQAVMCPACGLVRFYADIGGEADSDQRTVEF